MSIPQTIVPGKTPTMRCCVYKERAILGERVNFIAVNEAQYANTFGYTGCVQLTNCILKSNDKETKDFDKSWVKESTIKEIMETPITNNITTTIYKVNAVVNKKPGDGFINYYINDLDNKTGTYTYTQCNGNDFTWLDEFDGKVAPRVNGSERDYRNRESGARSS